MLPNYKTVLFILMLPWSSWGWMRSTLIYHLDEGRSTEGWQRNFMRIDENLRFTGQWLFDHVILTKEKVSGVDIMYGDLQGEHFLSLLQNLEQDVTQLDSALSSLTRTYPNGKVEFSIAVPYIDNKPRTVTVEGRSFVLSNPNDRKSLMSWYLNKVKSIFGGSYRSLQLWGVYYHREDVPDVYGDPDFVTYFNKEAHSLNLKTVWVPYYDAPYAWEGKSRFGFDELSIQPRYSFLSSIDKGSVKGDRLYGVGRMANERRISFEYELRSGGESQIENWIAHQYLAVAQSTGAWKYPQVFFLGLNKSALEEINGPSSKGDRWWAYSDLCNYLGGQSITNLEVGIDFSVSGNQAGPNLLSRSWAVPSGYGGLSSIRLDFKDQNGTNNYFRGRLVISQARRQAFGQRLGIDELNPNYSSIFVPLLNLNISEGEQLTIQLQKEDSGTLWPEIIQLIAAKYEPPFIANPILSESSGASYSVVEGPYADSQRTDKGYASGKLTDGRVSSNNWDWDGVMGWMLLEGTFTINLDLQQTFQSISHVKIYTHIDQGAGVRLPNKVVALISSNCQPQSSGLLTSGSCGANGSSNRMQVEQVGGDRYVLTLNTPNRTSGRYVTITGVALAWFLLDEVEVVDIMGRNLSRGKPYRVTPIPGEQKNPGGYPDDNRKLVDGAIFRKFVNGLGGVVGFEREGQVETTWVSPREVNCVRIWLTESDWGNFGILLPNQVGIQIRNLLGQWEESRTIQVQNNCGPAPCAPLCFPSPTRVTGVRGLFDNLQGWAMITEISSD